MLDQLSQQLHKTKPVLPDAHGHVVLILIFTFIFSSWLLYHGVNNQVQAYEINSVNQLAVEVTEVE